VISDKLSLVKECKFQVLDYTENALVFLTYCHLIWMQI